MTRDPEEARWIDRGVGDWFEVDTGGKMNWIYGQKISPNTFATNTGRTIKVSAWAFTRENQDSLRGES